MNCFLTAFEHIRTNGYQTTRFLCGPSDTVKKCSFARLAPISFGRALHWRFSPEKIDMKSYDVLRAFPLRTDYSRKTRTRSIK